MSGYLRESGTPGASIAATHIVRVSTLAEGAALPTGQWFMLKNADGSLSIYEVT